MTRREAIVDGRPYAYVERGSGPPLLLFHGWSGASDNFARWLPSLEPRFRVVVPDLPGNAGTPPLDETHTAAAYARFGRRFAASLGIGPLAVGGLCSGASIALSHAALYPDDTTALLLHTPWVHPAVVRGRMRAQLRLLGSPAGRLYGPLRRSETLSRVYRRFTDGGGVVSEDEERNRANLERADVRAGRELALDLLRADHRETLRSWKRPLFVIVAAADAFVALEPLRRTLDEVAPSARVEVLDGGHGWTAAYIERQAAALALAADALARAGAA